MAAWDGARVAPATQYKVIRVLGIPDEYDYQDPLLVSLLRAKVPPKLGTFQPARHASRQDRTRRKQPAMQPRSPQQRAEATLVALRTAPLAALYFLSESEGRSLASELVGLLGE